MSDDELFQDLCPDPTPHLPPDVLAPPELPVELDVKQEALPTDLISHEEAPCNKSVDERRQTNFLSDARQNGSPPDLAGRIVAEALSSTALAPRDDSARFRAGSPEMFRELSRLLTLKLAKSKELTEQQNTAIELLLAGRTDTQVAEELGLHRSTVWKWRRKDELFRLKLGRLRDEAFHVSSGRLRELVPTCLDVLTSEVQQGNYQAAVRILRLAGLDASKEK